MNKEDIIRELSAKIEDAGTETSATELADLYFQRGMALWGTDERARAMNDYARAVELNPDSPAAQALDMARSIMSFFNPDQFNP